MVDLDAGVEGADFNILRRRDADGNFIPNDPLDVTMKNQF